MDGEKRKRRNEERVERNAKGSGYNFVALLVWAVSLRTPCQHSLTGKRRFIICQWYLNPDRTRTENPPDTHTLTHKHRCTLMCWLRLCCDRHGGAGCGVFCLALTSMSLAETRRDTGPHQYLNNLTSLPPHFCRGLLLSTSIFPALFFFLSSFSLTSIHPSSSFTAVLSIAFSCF